MTNKRIPAATIARTVVLARALVNQLLSAAGKPVLPIDSASVEQWVTAGLTTAAAIWAWWENNSFTPEAIHADELLDQMRGEKVNGHSKENNPIKALAGQCRPARAFISCSIYNTFYMR